MSIVDYSSDACIRGKDRLEKHHHLGSRFTDDDLLPKPVEGLHGKHIVDISVGLSHFLAVTKTGAVYSWGWNDQNQLGHHDSPSAEVVAKPSKVNTPTVASGCRVAVHCGPSEVCWLLTVSRELLVSFTT